MIYLLTEFWVGPVELKNALEEKGQFFQSPNHTFQKELGTSYHLSQSISCHILWLIKNSFLKYSTSQINILEIC